MAKIVLKIIPILFIITFKLYSQEPVYDFEFDKEIARKYALIGFEEYNNKNPNDNITFTNDYNVNEPFFSSMYSIDCDNIKIKVVIVIFRNIIDDTFACALLKYSKDNYFDGFLDRCYTTVSITNKLNEIKNAKEIDFWNCGI